MPYLLKRDAAVPRSLGTYTDTAGNEQYETEGVNYAAGSVIYDEQIVPNLLERIQAGDDDHIASIFDSISDKEAEEILRSQGKVPPVAAEHPTEATALAESGREVLPQAEVRDLRAEDEKDAQERQQPVFDADPDVREAVEDLEPADEGRVRGEALADDADASEAKRATVDPDRPQPRRRKGKGETKASKGDDGKGNQSE